MFDCSLLSLYQPDENGPKVLVETKNNNIIIIIIIIMIIIIIISCSSRATCTWYDVDVYGAVVFL